MERKSLSTMNERVETVEEFKLRIAAIIRADPEHIPSPPKANRLLVRKKKVTSRKVKRAKMHQR